MGLLTFALVQALHEAQPAADRGRPGTTYRDLFERLQDIVSQQSTQQVPQLEGELDQVVLSGIVQRPEPFVGVSYSKLDESLTLEAGLLQGVTKGSEYTLYPAGTKDPKTQDPMGTARVLEARLGSASLQLLGGPGGLRPDLAHHARAVEGKHVFRENQLRVEFGDFRGDGQEGPERARAVVQMDVVTPAEAAADADVRIVRRTKAEESWHDAAGSVRLPPRAAWLVVRRDGSLIAALPDDANLLPRIRLVLEDEARWRGMVGMVNRDGSDPFGVRLKVTKVLVRGADQNGPVNKDQVIGPIEDPGDEGGVLSGERRRLCDAIDEGRRGARCDPFVAVIDVNPDGRVGVLWPPKLDQKNRVVRDGRWHQLEYPYIWRIRRPRTDRYGPDTFAPIRDREVFRVFATETYMPFYLLDDVKDARGMDVKGGADFKGGAGPLAEILRAAVVGAERTRWGSCRNTGRLPRFICDSPTPKSKRCERTSTEHLPCDKRRTWWYCSEQGCWRRLRAC